MARCEADYGHGGLAAPAVWGMFVYLSVTQLGVDVDGGCAGGLCEMGRALRASRHPHNGVAGEIGVDGATSPADF